jgi:hypothetical protein
MRRLLEDPSVHPSGVLLVQPLSAVVQTFIQQKHYLGIKFLLHSTDHLGPITSALADSRKVETPSRLKNRAPPGQEALSPST